MQSHSGKIQLFPAIPATWKNVKFKNLRAQGAFLINASMINGKVNRIEVFSEKGSPLKLMNPFGDNDYQCSVSFAINGSVIEILTKPGQKIMLW